MPPAASDRGRAYVRALLVAVALFPLCAGLLLAARSFRLAAMGVVAEAVVIDRVVKATRDGNVHLVFLQFRDEAGATRVARAEVLKSDFDAWRPLSTREVVYLPGAPEGARPGAAADVGLPALLLLVAAVFLFAARIVPARDLTGR